MSELQKSLNALDDACELLKSGGPFIGPKGGKYKDAAHTQAWKPAKPVKLNQAETRILGKMGRDRNGTTQVEIGRTPSYTGRVESYGSKRDWNAVFTLQDKGLAELVSSSSFGGSAIRVVRLTQKGAKRLNAAPRMSQAAHVAHEKTLTSAFGQSYAGKKG